MSIDLQEATMATDHFVKLASEMRKMQREYWKTGTWKSLEKARELEAKVDEALVMHGH